MDLNQLAHPGKFIGGVAVIASLIFVGFQIRSNTKTMRATSTYQAVHSWVEMNDHFALNPELAEAVDVFFYGSEALEGRKALLAKYRLRASMQRTEAQYYLFKAGLVGREIWENYRDVSRSIIADGPPHIRDWWRTEVSHNPWTSDFVQQLDPRRA